MKHIIVKVHIPISPLRLSIYSECTYYQIFLLLPNPNDAPHSKAKGISNKVQIIYGVVYLNKDSVCNSSFY